MMPLCRPWPILRQSQIWSPMLLYGKKLKQCIFSEDILVYESCRCSQLNEYMKLYEYQRSGSFIDLVPNHSDSILLNLFSAITADFNIYLHHPGERYRTSGPLVSFTTVGPAYVNISGNKPVYADDGATLTLTCTTALVSYPSNYTIRWMNDTTTKEQV